MGICPVLGLKVQVTIMIGLEALCLKQMRDFEEHLLAANIKLEDVHQKNLGCHICDVNCKRSVTEKM